MLDNYPDLARMTMVKIEIILPKFCQQQPQQNPIFLWQGSKKCKNKNGMFFAKHVFAISYGGIHDVKERISTVENQESVIFLFC